MLELFDYLIKVLENLPVDYMVSGSMALNNYTTPRMTRDIDIVIHLKPEDIEKFIKRFEGRFYLNPETIRQETIKNGMFNIIDNETGYKIDFIVRKETEYRKTEFARKIRTSILGTETWLVGVCCCKVEINNSFNEAFNIFLKMFLFL